MATFSTNLALTLLNTGEGAGTWGNTTNTNLGTLLEQAISGYVTQAVATGTDTTLTIPNGATGVARNMYIELTGTGGASTNLIVPANKKLYFIFNNSTGAVTVKVSGQTGVSVAAAEKKILVSNGTDIVEATTYLSGGSSLSLTTLTVTSANITTLTGTSANITRFNSTSAVISGNLGIGGTPNAYDKMLMTGNIPADSTVSYGLNVEATFTAGATSLAVVHRTFPSATSVTVSEVDHFFAVNTQKSVGTTITSHIGYGCGPGFLAGTNNYAFYGAIPSGSNRWNFYAGGTAKNYFKGTTYIDTTSDLGSLTSRFAVTNGSETLNGTAVVESTQQPRPCIFAANTATSGDNAFLNFNTEASYTARGSITYNRGGGVVAYNTTSDYRAKTVYGPVTNSGTVIDALKVYRGKMNGASVERPMLVAHEAQAVAPYSVTGEKDAVDEKGKPVYQQMDVSTFVPLLIAEIQTLRARVAALEAAK